MADTSGLMPHHSSTDAVLVAAIADGDADALAEAYDRHGGVIYSFALRLWGTEPAEDVTRDVFLSLWRSPEEFPPSDGSLRMPLLVRSYARVADPLEEAAEHGGAAVGAEGLAALTLSRLPAAERVAIALTYFGGLTYEQVAGMMQRPKDIVAEDLRAGLSRLAAA